jgi:plastocyanin
MSRMYVRSRALPAALVTAVGVAVALACGNPSGTGNGCAGTGAHTVINAQDTPAFVPSVLSVTHGESICWQNLGTKSHTITANGATIVDSSWVPDSVNAQLNPGSLFLRTFSRQGVHYFYKCSIHPNMSGEIDVL